MRGVQKQKVLDFIDSLHQAHEEIKGALEEKNIVLVQQMLNECQQFAYELGGIIEQQEGEGHITVVFLEEYCEMLFRVYEEMATSLPGANKIYKQLRKQMLNVENSAKKDIPVRKEIVFFPYKASMWDSLESIYLAAREDPTCDVYCVPVPYYDMNPDRSFGKIHYEGGEYPSDIEVTDWKSYNFEEREPDVIYFHNPYDDCNYVTSVHPRYYSANLKKYTKTLVYVPYYSTSGGMGESQRLCPAYINADYIVIQYPELRGYFDERIPDYKFLPLGSPKFDKVIKKCQNPQMPSVEWQEKLEGKRVYFYNTSISGMLENTEDFLKKLRYVFSCFEGKKDICLLWRPHPLLETTFDSMRKGYKAEYLSLKREFLEKNLGIYDTTPDVSDAIALSDAYIGDAGTSLTSLFGIAGKPIFILDNRLHSEPDEESWRKEVTIGVNYNAQDRFSVIQGNKLYVSEPFAYDYKYLCDLSEETHVKNYSVVYEIDNKYYACPQNTQNILIIDKNGKKEKIELEQHDGMGKFFDWAIQYEKYIVLIPMEYPAIVRYDTITREIKYLKKDIDVFVQRNKGVIKTGGVVSKKGKVYLASPTDRRMYIFDIKTLTYDITKLSVQSGCGYKIINKLQEYILMSSYEGKRTEIVCWNPDTNETKVYNQFPKGFKCIDPVFRSECFKQPFINGVLWGNSLYLAPYYANMYIKLDIVSGVMTEWKPPFIGDMEKEYFYTMSKSYFLQPLSDEKGRAKIIAYPQGKIYEINFKTEECSEMKIHFDVDELKKHERGFCRYSETLRYCCCENSFNSIRRFLDRDILGNPFDRDRQIEAYREIASNYDGTCGTKVHEFVSAL